MGYSNRFILCILVNGVPVKEKANGEVHIPFGTSYSIRLRNRHSRNAAVQIFIDGENVSGEGYKVPGNDKIDIHRYADKDVTFKFVDLDSPEAVEFGKNGPNYDKSKGLIEGRFYLEKEKPAPKPVEHHHHHHYPNPRPVWPIHLESYRYSGGVTYRADGSIDQDSYVNAHDSRGGARASGQHTNSTKGYSEIAKGGTVRDANRTVTCSSTAPASASYSSGPIGVAGAQGSQGSPGVQLREGATVEGHVSGQRFHKVSMDLETDYVSVKVFMKGYDPQNPPNQSVQSRLPEGELAWLPNQGLGALDPADLPTSFCEGCGGKRKDKSANFCGGCGYKHRS
jgi:hypothetical protein